jgi:hypothetical protein
MIKLMDLIREYSPQDLYGKTTPNRSTHISKEEIFSILESNKEFVKHWRENKPVIYRGNRKFSATESYIVSPSKYTRVSKNTKNYYTLILDNLPSWKSYPKRSKSIICSMSYGNASQYSNGQPHIVFPITDAKIGMCPNEDIWDSFKKSMPDGLNLFNSVLYELYEFLHHTKVANNLNTWDELLNHFSIITDNKEKIREAMQSEAIMYDAAISEFVHSNKSFYEYLEYAFDPIRNNFRLIDSYKNEYTELERFRTNEVWTDADCYLIGYYQMKEFSEKI